MSEAEFRVRLLSRSASAGLPLADVVVSTCWLYYDLLHRWNRRVNLTALPLDGFPSQTLDRLLIEPLVAASVVSTELRGAWVDLGSGGGSPAIPIKIARPALGLTMTESRGRKVAFLRETIRTTRLEGAEVLAGRFDTLASRPAGTFVLITARAVRIDQPLMDLAAHLLAPGGQLMLLGTDKPDSIDGFRMASVGDVMSRPGGLVVLERS